MHFNYCPHCGNKLTLKEIGDEGLIPYCPSCHVPLWDMFATAIICAVVNENQEVALLKQDYVSKTHCVLIAGIMQIKETAETTVKREIKEEIGLEISKLEYVQSYYYNTKEMLMLGFVAYVKKADFVLSSEVNQAFWCPLVNADQSLREGGIAYQLIKLIQEKKQLFFK